MKRCVIKRRYTVMMFTGGPWPADIDKTQAKNDIIGLTRERFGDKLDQVRVAMEINSEGYRHFHVGVKLTTQITWKTWNDALLNYIRGLPRTEDETRKPNGSTYYFGTDCKDPWASLCKYLTRPSKSKDVDDDVMEFEQPDYTKMSFMQRFWHECDGTDTGLSNGPMAERKKHIADMEQRHRPLIAQHCPDKKEWLERLIKQAKCDLHKSIFDPTYGGKGG